LVLRALLYGVEVVAEPAISSGHLPLLTGLVVTSDQFRTREVYASTVLLRRAMIMPRAVAVKGFPGTECAPGDRSTRRSIKAKTTGTGVSTAFVGVSWRKFVQSVGAAAPARHRARKAVSPHKTTIVD
jgi:hypothetical protein